MATVYTAIFRAVGGVGGTTVKPKLLVEWSGEEKGPRSSEVAAVLAQTPTQFPTQLVQPSRDFLYHILVGDASKGPIFLYVVVTKPQTDNSTVEALLDNMKGSLTARPDWLRLADSNRGEEPPLQAAMGSVLAEGARTVNASDGDKLSQLRSQVTQVKAVMVANVERMLERGDRLDDLMGRTEDLEQSSASFRASAARVQRSMCLKNCKWTIILIAAIVVIILIIVIVVAAETGAFKGHSSSSKTTTTPAP